MLVFEVLRQIPAGLGNDLDASLDRPANDKTLLIVLKLESVDDLDGALDVNGSVQEWKQTCPCR